MGSTPRLASTGARKVGATVVAVALLMIVSGLAVATHSFWQDGHRSPGADQEPVTHQLTESAAEDHQAAPYCDHIDTIEHYTCLIEQSALGASRFLRADKKNADAFDDVFTVLSTLDLVSTIVSSSRYYFLKKHAGEDFEAPGSKAALCLDRGYGICGNHYAVFEAFLERLGIPVRYVRMYFINKDTGNKNSHIAAEVEIDGSWRYVDVSKGAIWLADRNDLLSMLNFDDVMQGRGHLIHNAILPWTISKQFSEIDNFPYLRSEHLDHVVGDMQGLLHIYFEDTDGELHVQPLHAKMRYSTDLRGVPSYVSAIKGEADQLDHGIRYRLMLPTVPYMATFAIASISACDDASLSIGGHMFDLEGIDDSLRVQIFGGDIVEIVGASEPCRVSFTSIGASRVDAEPI